MTSPFHAGEREAQTRAGANEVERLAGRLVRPALTEQHQEFFAALPFVVAAARDHHERPWATLLFGAPGFIDTADPQVLKIASTPLPGDALEHTLGATPEPAAERELGLLGIDLATRRRNRVNGRLRASSEPGVLTLAVEQAFGNCPKHIHVRRMQARSVAASRPAQTGTKLSATQRDWIAAADTCFLASGYRGEGEHAAFGMDASHRGGEPGFVVVESDTRLSFPDYAGNNLFNTIGNLGLDPRIGITFVDFEAGSLLQISGRATIDWDSPAVARVAKARRLVDIDIDAVVELPGLLPLCWHGDAGPA